MNSSPPESGLSSLSLPLNDNEIFKVVVPQRLDQEMLGVLVVSSKSTFELYMCDMSKRMVQ